MKKAIFSSIFIFAAFCGVFAQDKPVKFTVTVSSDSILMNNNFEVKFVLENAEGQNFEAPDFHEHFNVLNGPNFSTSLSMVNGEITQSMTITYYLEPREIGSYYIMPASVKAKGEILETAPLEVLVVPNPDGIKQSPPRNGLQGFQFNFDENPFFTFPSLDDLPIFSFPKPDNKEEVQPKQEEQPVKKKRKTTRI